MQCMYWCSVTADGNGNVYYTWPQWPVIPTMEVSVWTILAMAAIAVL